MSKKSLSELQPAIKERAQVLARDLGLDPDAVTERLTELAQKYRRGHENVMDVIENKFRKQQGGKPELVEQYSPYYLPSEDPAEVIASDFQPTKGKPSGFFVPEGMDGSYDEDESESE